jgi:hypothetical protein
MRLLCGPSRTRTWARPRLRRSSTAPGCRPAAQVLGVAEACSAAGSPTLPPPAAVEGLAVEGYRAVVRRRGAARRSGALLLGPNRSSEACSRSPQATTAARRATAIPLRRAQATLRDLASGIRRTTVGRARRHRATARAGRRRRHRAGATGNRATGPVAGGAAQGPSVVALGDRHRGAAPCRWLAAGGTACWRGAPRCGRLITRPGSLCSAGCGRSMAGTVTDAARRAGGGSLPSLCDPGRDASTRHQAARRRVTAIKNRRCSERSRRPPSPGPGSPGSRPRQR